MISVWTVNLIISIIALRILKDLNTFGEIKNDTEANQDSKQVVNDIDHFLDKLATVNKDNCENTPKIEMDGIVQEYGTNRFLKSAMEAVNRANFLTSLWSSSDVRTLQRNERMFYLLVKELIERDEDVFGAGNCYEYYEFNPHRKKFCPYISRSINETDNETFHEMNLGAAYNYSTDESTSQWFFIPRRLAKKVLTQFETEAGIFGETKVTNLPNGTWRGSALDIHRAPVLRVRYVDGYWSDPYFDCGAGNIWMMTYTVGFFGLRHGRYFFKGTSGIDIKLYKVDIDQCPMSEGSGKRTNPFTGTAKCRQETTKCEPIHGEGFTRGAYKCVCLPGYYFPNTTIPLNQRYFYGREIEQAYDSMTKDRGSNQSTLYNTSFQCLKCPEHCENCTDSRPCVVKLDYDLRINILVLNCIIMLFIPVLLLFTFRYQKIKVLKAASPVLLRIIVMGAFLLYCPVIIGFFPVSNFTCCLLLWFREIGFCLLYGALLLKTWRISVVFRVRSAQRIKISDMDLIKRLGLLVFAVVAVLSVRMYYGRPRVHRDVHSDGMKAFICSHNFWDWGMATAELLFLMWGIRLCIVVRKAPSEFNESRFISWAIYNETLLSIFTQVIMYFVRKPADPDIAYLILFIHTQLTTTVTLAFLFGTKMYLVYKFQPTATKDGGPAAGQPKQHTVRFVSKGRGFHNAKSSMADNSPYPNATAGLMDQLDDDDDKSSLDKGLMEELKRLYTQVEGLKQKNMRLGNRHVHVNSTGNIFSSNKNQLTVEHHHRPISHSVSSVSDAFSFSLRDSLRPSESLGTPRQIVINLDKFNTSTRV